jgi:seryl-tRNA synthetase
MTGEAERIAVVESDLRNHVKTTEDATRRVEANGAEIKTLLRDLSRDLKDSVQRIHTVIDEKVEALQQDIANVESIARAEAKVALAMAQDAHDKIAAQSQDQATTIVGVKLWVVVQAISALAALAVAAAWVYDHFSGAPMGHH